MVVANVLSEMIFALESLLSLVFFTVLAEKSHRVILMLSHMPPISTHLEELALTPIFLANKGEMVLLVSMSLEFPVGVCDCETLITPG